MAKPPGWTRGSARRPAARERVVAPSEPALGPEEAAKHLQSVYGKLDENWATVEFEGNIKQGTPNFQVREDYIDGSETMNQMLRRDADLSRAANVVALRDKMDNLIRTEGVTLDRDIIVYRGVSQEVARSFKPGSAVVDKGFTSTTTDKAIAKGFLGRNDAGQVTRIKIPKGTRVALFGGYESEIVLPRGGKYTMGDNGVLTYGG